MAKLSQQNRKSNNANNNTNTTANTAIKVKRTRRSVPRDSPPQRSSVYRGVTRHRWTGRIIDFFLLSLGNFLLLLVVDGLDIATPNYAVYLGAYDDEQAAAHAYDLAALKYWGQDTILNFPLATYEKELKEMEGVAREEYIGSLRRKSSGFSRGVSKYRGVARHHHNGRWEARIGRVFGNKYLYLGTYATQEEAATAYDMAAIEYRGLNAVTNFDLSRYIKWLKPNGQDNENSSFPSFINTTTTTSTDQPNLTQNLNQELGLGFFQNQQQTSGSGETILAQPRPATATSALGLLLQSTKFKEMMEMTSAVDSPVSPPESDPPQCTFPDDIQTYFDCQDSSSYGDHGDDIIFGELNSLMPPMFQCDF
ncbi:hypothetical protein FEM48_Zijuj01G0164800 [Ziziphus jujuba var. spinosa]|uniref:AP2/ERF domain-containing protein n=1 Tax=Ziziphus jujuba var. spinosa TaxID=714518 RepID=A0A978W2B6_ZIZJJ|nr:hypothetical protein FEM48_Zijuj01G0164800 [Ziziphus jujuba var. spinosa]